MNLKGIPVVPLRIQSSAHGVSNKKPRRFEIAFLLTSSKEFIGEVCDEGSAGPSCGVAPDIKQLQPRATQRGWMAGATDEQHVGGRQTEPGQAPCATGEAAGGGRWRTGRRVRHGKRQEPLEQIVLQITVMTNRHIQKQFTWTGQRTLFCMFLSRKVTNNLRKWN